MFVLHIQQTVKSGFFKLDPALSERGTCFQVMCISVFPLKCLCYILKIGKCLATSQLKGWFSVVYVTYST